MTDVASRTRTFKRTMSLFSAALTLTMACSSQEEPNEIGTGTSVVTVALRAQVPQCTARSFAHVYYVQKEASFYYCDGRELVRLDLVGKPGEDGQAWLVALAPADASECPSGGVAIQVGPDLDESGELEADEVASRAAICNGRDGADGEDGEDGKDGMNGVDGVDGKDGTDGADGQDGADGADGQDGADGSSCSVVDNGDGTKTISCEDGTTVTVSDGVDGDPVACNAVTWQIWYPFLAGCDLDGADLSGFSLSDADLSGANLGGADLQGADLSGANLSGANLSGANLSGVDVSGADLSDANLSGAELSGAVSSTATTCPDASPGPCSAFPLAGTLEYTVGNSPSSSETTPAVSRDSLSAFVVHSDDRGRIFVRRIDESGKPLGLPLQVNSDPDAFAVMPDAWGSRVIWTEYESRTSLTGIIRLYDLVTAETLQVSPQPDLVREARIHNNTIVWISGPNGATQVKLYDLRWNNFAPVTISPPSSAPTNVDIGNRYVAWDSRSNSQQDVVVYDLLQGTMLSAANDPVVHERFPATSGDWVVWQQVVEEATGPRASIQARNMRTGQRLTIADDGALNQFPAVDQGFISYDSDVNGNSDVFLYRISDATRFQVTTGAADEVLSNLFEGFVAYATNETQSDVFVRRF